MSISRHRAACGAWMLSVVVRAIAMRSGERPRGSAGAIAAAGALTGAPASAPRTSLACTRPRGPLPARVCQSMPASAARCRAAGEPRGRDSAPPEVLRQGILQTAALRPERGSCRTSCCRGCGGPGLCLDESLHGFFRLVRAADHGEQAAHGSGDSLADQDPCEHAGGGGLDLIDRLLGLRLGDGLSPGHGIAFLLLPGVQGPLLHDHAPAGHPQRGRHALLSPHGGPDGRGDAPAVGDAGCLQHGAEGEGNGRGSQPVHRCVEVVEPLLRGNGCKLRAEAGALAALLGDDEVESLLQRLEDGLPVQRNERAGIDDVDLDAFGRRARMRLRGPRAPSGRQRRRCSRRRCGGGGPGRRGSCTPPRAPRP